MENCYPLVVEGWFDEIYGIFMDLPSDNECYVAIDNVYPIGIVISPVEMLIYRNGG